MRQGSWSRRALWLLAICAGMIVSSLAVASELGGVLQVSLEVASQAKDGSKHDSETRKEIAKRAVPLIEKRLRAAQFEHVVVEARGRGSIFVETGGDIGRNALLSLLIPTGEFQLRPVVDAGKFWQSYAPKAPAGVELRQPSDSMKPREGFVWSEKRSLVAKVAGSVENTFGDVFAYPAAGGWRTLTLGEVALDNDDVANVKIRPGRTGEPYVAASLSESANERLRLRSRGRGDRWAVVLDGEVVALLDRTPGKTGNLNVPAPDHIAGREAKLTWARQVAARMAALIPPRLVPLGQLDQKDSEDEE